MEFLRCRDFFVYRASALGPRLGFHHAASERMELVLANIAGFFAGFVVLAVFAALLMPEPGGGASGPSIP